MRKTILFFLIVLSVPAAAAETAEWTMLLFMNGKNNLEEYVDEGLKQMEQVGSTPDIHVVAQVARLSEPDRVTRVRVLPSADPSKITSPAIETLGAVDMGDYRSLQEFIHWGVEKFPARHYILVVWNHGYGWHDDTPEEDERKKPNDISTDDITNHTITTLELAATVKDFAQLIGRKLDIFSSDACFMASLEVAYEMAPYADYYLGSEELEPLMGWPYHHILEQWVKDPKMSPESLGRVITDEYVKFHDLGIEVTKREVAYSLLDLSKMDAFITAFRDFSHSLLPNDVPEVFAHGSKALAFDFEDYVDWGDLLKHYNGSGKLSESQTKLAAAATSAYGSLVLFNRVTSELADATGASVWLPKNRKSLEQYLARYRELRFAAATGWDRVLERWVH